MGENLLQLGIEDLFVRLHLALVDQQSQSIQIFSRVAEQHWAFAIARRQRDRLRALCGKLLQAASTAAALEEDSTVASAWNQRWLALSEMGELILAADTESAAAEDRQRLKAFEHAETVMVYLLEQGIVASGDLQSHTGMTPQTCWNHLSRLVKAGLVQRVDEGLYRLAPRGQKAAEILEQEKKQRQQKATQSLEMRLPPTKPCSEKESGLNNLKTCGVISLDPPASQGTRSSFWLQGSGSQPVSFGHPVADRR
jgi:DNA-binding MarR family transcriptional regulator